LGSATPALETYYASQIGQLQLLTLPRRIMGHAKVIAEQQARLHLRQTVYQPVRDSSLQVAAEARYADLPKVQVIDLRQELRAGNRSMFSRALHQAMDEALAAGQQAILFLNRRGAATFIMCRDCGHVLTCEHCDVPLTYHETGAGGQKVRGPEGQRDNRSAARETTTGEERGLVMCHHCGRRAAQPERCPECQSRRIRYLGAGTEKIGELVQTLWPAARVVRWDRDVTGHKGSHDAILAQFVNRQANVMVGTQMIAKGLDLPMVTLVGVISADVGLYLPDFRAAERSFQLLTQVAGRAGRSLLGGRVIIQSYRPEHYAIQASRLHDYQDFYRQEISFRRQLGYPPFRRLARMIYLHGDREHARAEAGAMARGLRLLIRERGLSGVDLIGPAPCFFGREGGNYRWQILVRAADPALLLRSLDIPQGWRVDVDPVSVL
jgi:primosomal protein N' (replication factor Y)